MDENSKREMLEMLGFVCDDVVVKIPLHQIYMLDPTVINDGERVIVEISCDCCPAALN